jgi:hypothetical protein
LKRRDPLIAFVMAGAIAAAVLWLGPPGSDTAAHVYQLWFFKEHGFTLWDNYWYSGRYAFVTYSWLYYPLAAVVGIKLLAMLSLAVAAAAFTRLVTYRPAALAFAVVWGAFALSGAYPFMLGVAFALIALNTRRWFPVFAALAWAASPLALLLLGVVVVGLRRWRAVAAVVPLVVLQLVLAFVYPSPGHFPFSWVQAVAAVAYCAVAIALTSGRPIRGVFVAWLVLLLVSFVLPSQLGENAARLRFMALPLALLVLRGRPMWVAVPLAVVAGVYNASPLIWSFRVGHDERAEQASYWAPAIAYLRAHTTPDFRVNALDTVGHWEAVYLPKAGIPITRGWYRQDDFPQNEVLYHRLDERTYLRWLHERGVKYVVVPDDRLDYTSARELPLLSKWLSATKFGDVTIYEVPHPTPIVPGARVLRLGHDSITVQVPRRGRYPVSIRDGRSGRVLDAPRRGTYTLRFP